MAQGDLYKMGRLVQDERFRVKVRAAMLVHAQTQLGTTAPAESRNLAIWALINPEANEISMVSLVAADTTVLNGTTVTNETVSHDDVADSTIQSRVVNQWTTVAKKYPTSPLAPPA
jgi:hypothetical protein